MSKRTVRRLHRAIRKIINTTIIATLIIITLMFASYVETRYTRDAKVESITETTTTFVDVCGHTWEYGALDNVVEGQMVKLKMFTSHTDSIISDDVILEVKAVAIE